jgi:5-hydroxytryptamine receptor 2
MAIRAPLTNRNKSKTVVILKIIIVWVISITISSPITILGFIDQSNVLIGNYCVLSNKHFMIYGSICAFFIPLFIMILSYSLTVYLLIKQAKKCQKGKHKGKLMIRRSLSRKPIRRQTTNIMNTIPITLDAFCSVWTSSVFILAALSSS